MLTHALTVALLSLIAAAIYQGKRRPSLGRTMAILFAVSMLGLCTYAVWSTLTPH